MFFFILEWGALVNRPLFNLLNQRSMGKTGSFIMYVSTGDLSFLASFNQSCGSKSGYKTGVEECRARRLKV